MWQIFFSPWGLHLLLLAYDHSFKAQMFTYISSSKIFIRETSILVVVTRKLFIPCWLWIPVTFWTLYFNEFLCPLCSTSLLIDTDLYSSQSGSSDRMMRDCSPPSSNTVSLSILCSLFIAGIISHHAVQFTNTGVTEEKKSVNPIARVYQTPARLLLETSS